MGPKWWEGRARTAPSLWADVGKSVASSLALRGRAPCRARWISLSLCNRISLGFRSMPERILLVEDDRDTLDVEEALLRHIGGYTIERAASVSAALSAFEKRRPDMVVLDIVMPDALAWEFLEEPLVQRSTVPIVIV